MKKKKYAERKSFPVPGYNNKSDRSRDQEGEGKRKDELRSTAGGEENHIVLTHGRHFSV